MTALRMVEEIDAGPVYVKEPMSLEGAAEEIYLRANLLIASMIARIIQERPQPSSQNGPVVQFARRSPKDSELPRCDSLFSIHDHIRMLDAEGYPKAFFIKDGYRYEFSRSALKTGKIVAEVEITPVEE